MIIESKDIHNFMNDITLNDYIEIGNYESFKEKRPSISYIIIVKNEERVIKRCIESILKQLEKKDEIIIVDTGSIDSTIEIIDSFQERNISVQNYKWDDNFSKARNFAKEFAKKDWVFYIDADEYITEGSVEILKKYIAILKNNTDKNIFINPTIINTNDHIINGVTRIFENKNAIQFKGLIHEYPMIEDDVIRIAFESVSLIHDGYDENLIDMNKKINRNLNLLNKMRKEENSLRWDYLYCRDGGYIWEVDEQISNLEQLLHKWTEEKESDAYYSATRDLIELYLNIGEIEKAKKKITSLKTLAVNESDIFYFEHMIHWIELKIQEGQILNSLIEYRKTRKKIDYGALHSNYFHIDFLISQLLWNQGELVKGYKIQNKLNKKGVFDYTIDINQISNIAQSIEDGG
ncbi:glycosyltransferase family 2 protein [Staphylococcus xylosus]|uniref:glycosyltransferase family 2 protein n=2 Tax=Staphylococcus xylosus TaxID=1288 RepID=UPI00298EE26B|nr:glycosyltransferase family 2 protein [Staphylococcus xylosus]MDW8555058.1 glycosyltransferase family 2 protein [Staphylococcus xylosus]